MKARIGAYSFMILVLAAHFSRGDHNLVAVITLFIPLLLLIKKAWVIYVLQAVGVLGAVAWIFSIVHYVQQRLAAGDDWLRLLIILGLVVIYSLWATYFLSSGPVKTIYHVSETEA